MKYLLIAVLTFCCRVGFAGEVDQGSDIERALALEIAAWTNAQPAPKLVASGLQLSVEQAYQVQANLVAHIYAGQKLDGFKAGLTGSGDPQRFGLVQPMAGVLPPASEIVGSGDQFELDISRYHRAMVELELGYIFSSPLAGDKVSLSELKAAVSAVLPILELPDLGFAAAGVLHGKDVIAANASAKHYIRGARAFDPSTDINAIQLKLYRDGQLLTEGRGSDALGDQWQALYWLVNQRLSSGWKIEEGQLLITGAIGKMIALERGQYRAEYGGQAVINLRVY